MIVTMHLGENTHLGFEGKNAALQQGLTRDKSNSVPGIQACLRRKRIGFRSCGKERDTETGLDNFGARYMSSPLGRFTSPDPLGGNIHDPQTINKYVYVRNNPLRFTDPTGMYICENSTGVVNCDGEFAKFEEARQAGLKMNSNDIVRAMEAYGNPGEDNGVRLRFGDPGGGKTGSILYNWENDASAPNGMRAAVQITIKSGLGENDLMAGAAHEGAHVADAQDFIKSITDSGADYGLNFTKYDNEMRAYLVEHAVHLLNNQTRSFTCGNENCRLGVGAADPNRQIQNHLHHSYSVSPSNSGNYMYPAFAPVATIPKK